MDKLKYKRSTQIIQNHMFLITLLLYLLNYKTQTFYIAIGSWNLNRMAGWGWDISNLFWLEFLGSMFVFTICYGIIKLTKRKTNFNLSIGHIVTMLLYIITSNIVDTSDYVVIMIGCFMWGAFIANIFKCGKIAV